jgi:hypothetical protein
MCVALVVPKAVMVLLLAAHDSVLFASRTCSRGAIVQKHVCLRRPWLDGRPDDAMEELGRCARLCWKVVSVLGQAQ